MTDNEDIAHRNKWEVSCPYLHNHSSCNAWLKYTTLLTPKPPPSTGKQILSNATNRNHLLCVHHHELKFIFSLINKTALLAYPKKKNEDINPKFEGLTMMGINTTFCTLTTWASILQWYQNSKTQDWFRAQSDYKLTWDVLKWKV